MRVLAGAMMILASVATPVTAQKEDVSEHMSIELDAYFSTDYSDSDFWGSGLGGGVTGFYALSTTTFVGARFSVTQWSYEPGSIGQELVNDISFGSDVTSEHSSGHVRLVSLTPLVRYQRDAVLGQLGAFIAAGAGVAYMKESALTEVTYFPHAAGEGTAEFEIDNSDVNATFQLLAGLRFPVSSSSCLELISSYRTTVASNASDMVGVGIGFHIRV